MNFYTQQHKHYCGIDLHARAMYVCILDQQGTKLVHKNLPTTPEAFLRLIAPYREDLVVGVECSFTWYWLAEVRRRKVELSDDPWYDVEANSAPTIRTWIGAHNDTVTKDRNEKSPYLVTALPSPPT